jgi:hypothetical protein
VHHEEHLVLRLNDKEYEFDLTKATVLSGHVSQSQLVHDVAPHQKRLVLRGSSAATDALSHASPGQKLMISGYHRTGSNELHVSKISAAAPASAPTAK